jgi:hypothetical protein
MDLVQLRVEISRLLTLAAKARAEGDTAQADKLRLALMLGLRHVPPIGSSAVQLNDFHVYC